MTPSEDVIIVKGLTKTFGNRPVLSNIDLSVAPGEAVVLLGKSGAGKTTLMRCLNLLEQPTEGVISINQKIVFANGIAPKSRELVALRQDVGMVFQNFGLFPHLTALENITVPLMQGANVSQDEAISRALSGLRDVGLIERAFDLPTTLSGGQQQRVAIARALALRPAALLFDEPTSALDLETIADLVRILEDLKTRKMTMVIVTHDISFAFDIGDRVAYMKDGQIKALGTPAELLQAPPESDVGSFLKFYRKSH